MSVRALLIARAKAGVWTLALFVGPPVNGARERNATVTVTMNMGKVVEEARREIERSRIEHARP
jgi:hypothetical protein